MAVTAQIRNIDLGAVELNDVVSSLSYSDLAEMQNAVFKDSRSALFSFLCSAGYSVFKINPFAVFTVDIPEGIDQIKIESFGTDFEMKFYDLTAGGSAIFSQAHAATPDRVSNVYAVPASGFRSFGLEIAADGVLNSVLVNWDAQTIP